MNFDDMARLSRKLKKTELELAKAPCGLPLCKKCHGVYVDLDEQHCGQCAHRFGLPRKRPATGKVCKTPECGNGELTRRQVYCPKCTKERRRITYRESKRRNRLVMSTN
jgi:hypothetical protein